MQLNMAIKVYVKRVFNYPCVYAKPATFQIPVALCILMAAITMGT